MGASRLLVNKTKNEIFYYGCPRRYEINKIKEVLSLGWDKNDEIYFMEFSFGTEKDIDFEISKYNGKIVLEINNNIKDFDIEKLKEKYPINKNNSDELTLDHLYHFRDHKFITFEDPNRYRLSDPKDYIIWSKVDG